MNQLGRRRGPRTKCVGRERELVLLDWWRAEVLDGDTVLIMASGEHGVGMSRLMREWTDGLRRRGFRLLEGACYPDGAPPFIALATALDRITGMNELFLASDHDLEPAARELQLYMRIASGLLGAATHQPTALILQDLHWADAGTWEIVRHVVARAAEQGSGRSTRLLIVVTYRPDQLEPRNKDIVARLLKEPITHPLIVEGLEEPALNELLADLCAAPPSRSFAQWVLETTHGRPLLAIDIVETLTARGMLEVRNGQLTSRVAATRLRVAADPGRLWTERIAALTPEHREQLEWVALLGGETSVDELAAVLVLDDDSVEAFMTEATRAGILVEDGLRVRFAQDDLRHALLSTIPERTLQAREGKVAERLIAQVGEDVGLHAARIVPHLRRAPAVEPYEGLLRTLAREAAAQASAVAAWGTAAADYEDALQSMDPQAPVVERLRVRLQAAEAHVRNQDYPAARSHLLSAVDLARASNDFAAWGEAMFWLTNVEVLRRDETFFDAALVPEFLRAAGDDATDEQALVLANIASLRFGQFDLAAGTEAVDRARELAARSSRTWVKHFVAEVEGVNYLGALQLEDAKICFTNAVCLSSEHEDPWQAAWAEVGLPLVQLLSGDHDHAEANAARAEAASFQTHQWNLHGLAIACQAAIALARGQAEDAARLASAAIQSYHRSDYFYAAALGYPTLIGALSYLGERERGRRVVTEWRAIVGPLAARHEMLFEAICGNRDRARELSREHPLVPLPPTATLFSLTQAVSAVEVGDRLDELDVLRSGYDHLVDAYDHGVRFSLDWSMCLPRLLAQAALRLGDESACEKWLTAGFAAARTAASPVELARLRLVRAHLLFTRAETDNGLLELEYAYRFFEAAGLLSLAAETRRMAPTGMLTRRANIVIALTELTEPGLLSDRISDQLYQQLQREVRRIARQGVASTGGTIFDESGDTLGSRFADVDSALEFALTLGVGAELAAARHPMLTASPRTAVVVGDAYEDDGVLSGRSVVRAGRMLELAEDGQVVVGEEVRKAADPARYQFTQLGLRHIRGFRRPESLYLIGPVEP